MDYAALKNYIVADATLSALAGDAGINNNYPDSKDGTIADALNIKNIASNKSTMATARTLLASLNPVDAAAILDALDAASASNSVVKWAMKFLTSDPGLDIGHPNLLTMLDQLQTAGVLTAAQVSSIKSLSATTISIAEQQFGQLVSGNDVSTALGRPPLRF